ncbi:MAG TPA: hypothetical protein VNL77_10150 [Roseiflexaceae bacterium]|nr:hypothetical protein [Roseiflexaceae bacterium]
MSTTYTRAFITGAAAALVLALALLLAAATPARAGDAPGAADPTATPAATATTEPSATAEVTPTATAQPTATVELAHGDLGSSGAPIDDTQALTETILPALADFLAREKAAPGSAADLFYGSTIPERPKGASTTVYLPFISGPRQSQPGPGDPGGGNPPPPEKGADVTVVAWPAPSIRVARDGVLTYEIRLYNDGEGDARRTVVTLPYNPGQLTPIGSDLDRGAGDWVSEVRADALVVTFGPLDEQERRLGYVYFRVGRLLADNTVLSMRPAYTWSDARGTHERSGNWAPVLVGGGNDTGAYVWTIVQPVDGQETELRTFYSNRFVPGETVATWLNTPTGVAPLPLSEKVDEQGQVWLEYRPSSLLPGTYQLVVYGARSRLTGVATFIVR